MILLFGHVIHRLILFELAHHNFLVSEGLKLVFAIVVIFLSFDEVVGQPALALAFGPFTCDNFLATDSLSVFLHKSHLVARVQEFIIIRI